MTGSYAGVEAETHSELSRLLEYGGLPDRIRQKGLKLLQRIGRPVRVTLMGTQGSGKTNVLNMLLGGPLMPKGQPLCDVLVEYSESPKLSVMLRDGTLKELSQFDLKHAYSLSPAAIHVGAPIEILRQISLTEIGMNPETGGVSKSMLRALAKTDVSLWCSTGFSELDRKFWDKVPEEHKDHAFLILTQADKLARSGRLADVMDAMAPIVSTEFHSFFAVAARQGRMAWKKGELVDPQAWVASGGAALVTALKAHAARGKQEEIDNAKAYLDLYATTMSKRPLPDHLETEAVVVIPNKRDTSALSLIKEKMFGLHSKLHVMTDDPDEIAASAILQACSDTMMDAVSIASEQEGFNEALLDDLDQASEMITLLHLEGGLGPAADAVNIIGQVQEDVEFRLVA